MDKNKRIPYPEIVSNDKREYTIHEETTFPRVCLETKDMYIPLKPTQINRWLRAHEMGHVAISPLPRVIEKTKISMKYLAPAEDYRVNRFINPLGVSNFDPRECQRIMESFDSIPKNDIFTLASFYIASKYTSYEAMAEKKFKEANLGIYTTFQEGVQEILLTCSVETFNFYTKVKQTRREFLPKDVQHFLGVTVPIAKLLMALDSPKEQKFNERKGANKKGTSTNENFGEMSLKKAPLERKINNGKNSSIKIPVDNGIIPYRMDRFFTDQKVFVRKKHVDKPLTILLDASGSMKWSIEAIDEIVTSFSGRAVSIYLYGGKGATGDLFLVSQNGMTITKERLEEWREHTFNSIDLPALEYIIANHKTSKLVWVSDQMVNGISHLVLPQNVLKCKTICRANKIQEIICTKPDAKQIIDAIKKGIK